VALVAVVLVVASVTLLLNVLRLYRLAKIALDIILINVQAYLVPTIIFKASISSYILKLTVHPLIHSCASFSPPAK
jgi:hypothetical protein